MTGAEAILVEIENGCAWVTLNRPEVYNAVDLSTMERLGEVLEAVASSPPVRCVVLGGVGKAFCSGADLDLDSTGMDGAEGARMLDAARRVVTTITGMPIPVIAAVGGPAAGVGASLAFASDLIIAAEEAYFYLPFVGIGLMPDGGATLTVAASIGRARAMRMALRRERLGARAALEAGLIAEVCAGDELTTTVSAWVEDLVHGPVAALARTKMAINDLTLGNLATALAIETRDQIGLLRSADFAEGVAAFSERRAPRFGQETGSAVALDTITRRTTS